MLTVLGDFIENLIDDWQIEHIFKEFWHEQSNLAKNKQKKSCKYFSFPL